ncbi:MAG TPA: hypothetical protein VFQ78_05900 [Candidatus Udaeobacter sp.]|jgi:hypothetical protein|nr:hypothetical protein [Candidatus Udaeobacter sp.]
MNKSSQLFLPTLVIAIALFVCRIGIQAGEIKASSPGPKAKDQAGPHSQQSQPPVLPPFTLWYNGDSDLSSQQQHGTGLCYSTYDPFGNDDGGGYNSHIYDDFIVSNPNG